MIKFLGTLHMRKLDLKHEPRLKRITFLEWISQLEIAFSRNKYTIKVLQDFSTKNKIHKMKSKLVDSLVYIVAYAFMQKANKVRNYDINISERKFLWVLLYNMKHHKYYKERIASFLTTFDLNPSSISQRWIENKFYPLDEERMYLF